MLQVSEHSGNIFNSTADAVVVTVNCLGFMGKGMALECALRHQDVEREYKILCETNQIGIGKMTWVSLPNGKTLVLFPTKTDFKYPSKYEYIEAGLEQLVNDVASRAITSLAVPRLGAELGGLEWGRVRPQIINAFNDIDIELELWTFGPQFNDPLILLLNSRLESQADLAMRDTGVTARQIDTLIQFTRRNTSATLVDVLSIPGIGKVMLKKLVKWVNEPQADSQMTLFG